MNVVVLTTSYEEVSRSSVAAGVAIAHLERETGVEVTRLDLATLGVSAYPGDEDDPARDAAVAAFQAADAYVIATPVHNWGAAAATTAFLSHALDPDDARRFRPVLVLGGAGTPRSHLALDGLVRTLQSELDAVVIGKPLLACGEDVDRKAGTVRPDLAERIVQATTVLVQVARARATR